MSKNNYPRLLLAPALAITGTPPLVPDATCTTHPLPTDLLVRLSNRLQEGSYTTTKEFIALCEYNINPQFEAYVRDMTGGELRTASAMATIGIKRWQARRSPAADSKPDVATMVEPSASPNSNRKTYRSSTAAKAATIRDQRRCLITLKDDPVEVAHLVPLSTYANANDFPRAQPAFITLLQMFAGEETKQNVMNYLGLTSPSTSTTTAEKPSPAAQKLINRMENLMTLSTETHRYWDTGKIILQPVGDPLARFTTNPDALLTHYDVTFSYVPGHRRPSATVGWDETTLVQLCPIPNLQFSEDDDPGLHSMFLTRLTEPTPPLPSEPPAVPTEKKPSRRAERFKALETGTVIRLTTTDPQKYPLPHPDLLRLHAALSRVVRCAAAAEPECMDLEDDDDGDVSEMGLEDLVDFHYHNHWTTSQTPVDLNNKFSTNPMQGNQEMTLQGPSSAHQGTRVWEFLDGLPSPPPSSPVCGPLELLAGDMVRNSATPVEVEGGRKRGYVEDAVAGKRIDDRVDRDRRDRQVGQWTQLK